MDGIELTTRVAGRLRRTGRGRAAGIPAAARPARGAAAPRSSRSTWTRDGLTVAGLRAAGPVSAVYLQPRAQNPTGVSLTMERAAQLAEVLAFGTAAVIEDDSAGAIAQAPPISLGRWLPERTVHVRSFAKSHGPDLRLAALSAPADFARRITALRQLGQGWSSRLLQRLLLGAADRCRLGRRGRARARDTYAARRAALVAELAAARRRGRGHGRHQPLGAGRGRDGRGGAAGQPGDRRRAGCAVQRPRRRPARPGDGRAGPRRLSPTVADALAAAARNTVRVPV